MNNKSEYPRILVISNNAFSTTSNNGKTLASFFKGFPPNKVAQLYFNSELPSDDYYKNHFRITDSEMVKSFISSRRKPGSVIEVSETIRRPSDKSINFLNKVKKFNLTRIVREYVWLEKKWNNDSLNKWLKSFSPNVIFLCAGDSGFSYKIAHYIQREYRTKLIVYITDDYILPRKTWSPFWWLRRNYIYKYMKKSVKNSDLFITISEEMRKKYKDIFGVDSILAMNITESLKNEGGNFEGERDQLTLVYTGGLHYNRYKTLNLLAKSIKKYNSERNSKKIQLRIYSANKPDISIQQKLNIEGASKYCGSLNQAELKKVLNDCDIPVHVESFDPKSIESTRLSISTKIPEYLSLEKPILAIGPTEVASMKYLVDCAYCITDPSNAYSELKNFIDDSKLRNNLTKKALSKFKKNHNKEVVLENLYNELIKVN